MARIKGGTIVLKVGDDGTLKLYEQKTKKAKKAVDKLGTSAHTADRRLKGAAQASSGGTKNFSKMAQGINGGLVPAYATLAASLFAIGALFRGLEEAANIKNQTKGMEIFGEATGIAMKGIVADLRNATGGMLDFRTAAQQAQIATAAGFNADQIISLGKGAQLASVALGRDLTDSFNRLLRGVTKAEPELLDELGIILRIDDATRKYAQANDLVASKLTIAQRRAAVFEEVSRQLANNFGDFEDGAEDALNSFSRLQVAFSDILKGLTVFIGPLEYVAEFLAQNTGAATLLFAGFASSIMKSAFPALNNLQASLISYKATSESALRAEKVKFQQYANMFKKNAADANLAELKKSATFKKFLKKRGMDEKAFNAKSVVNQRRSISLMIANLQKRAAAGKAINDAELAYFIKTRNQMVGVQAGVGTKLVGIAGATGAGIGAAITVPALLARLGLAKLGAAALALAPIFAGVGAVISGAFTIFTVGFLAKFLYDIVFITKEEKIERQKIQQILETSAEKIKEINRIGTSMFEKGVEGVADTVEGLNSKLLATFRLIQSIRGVTAATDIIENNTSKKGLDKTTRQGLTAIILEQITALSTQGGNIDDIINQIFTENEQGENIFGKYIGGTGDKKSAAQKRTINSFKGTVDESGAIGDKGLDMLRGRLFGGMDKAGAAGQPILAFIAALSEQLTTLAKPGEVIDGVTTGAKQVKDALAVIGDGYKPTSLDTLTSSLQKLKNEFNADDTAALFDVINKMFGTNFADNTAAESFVSARTSAAEEIVKQQAKTLRDRSGNDMEVASFGSRRDAQAELSKEKLKELRYTIDIEEKSNAIREQQEFLLLSENQGNEVAERKLVNLKLQLDILRAQDKEYKRSNTIAGQLQDTFKDGLDDMFLSIIDGSARAKDAFKQLAVVIIQEMQRILAVRMASQILQMFSTAFNPTSEVPTNTPQADIYRAPPGTGGGAVPGGRYGGVYGKGYNTGGIADGPTSGYNVIMHGREAVVPLPDGDRIPVQLSGKGMGPTNTTINVVVNNEGEAEATTEESTAFAETVQLSVLQTIAEQQRPGGLLNPGG